MIIAFLSLCNGFEVSQVHVATEQGMERERHREIQLVEGHPLPPGSTGASRKNDRAFAPSLRPLRNASLGGVLSWMLEKRQLCR